MEADRIYTTGNKGARRGLSPAMFQEQDSGIHNARWWCDRRKNSGSQEQNRGSRKASAHE